MNCGRSSAHIEFLKLKHALILLVLIPILMLQHIAVTAVIPESLSPLENVASLLLVPSWPVQAGPRHHRPHLAEESVCRAGTVEGRHAATPG